ncbi:hypothetical protein [Desulforamulus aeronauticus]|uniref:Uncharacterized protein n=1 Tax=Desulforamulus aeronauticus DSM 10349 TaxID=1121421 RepID=A0A1M6VBF1_9FIRM|nr:hypothetical protein [Desulforamulus aeronauticus]SHK78779.1 hypothetical protein SAMN02745123_03113 [Desulforamulus aeronauticus DSM 10349]
MNIYKLFYSENKPDLDKNLLVYITGKCQSVFGLKVIPETYRDFMNSLYDYFYQKKIRQHIMTNHKFISLIKNHKILGLEIADIRFVQDEELKITKNEVYFELCKGLNNEDYHKIIESLEFLLSDGFHIFRVDFFIETSTGGERILVHQNGTISFAISPDIMESSIQKNKILDFLVKGPEVICEG